MPKNMLLRQQRMLHNWRQQDLADQLGTTVITIQRWERGTQQPSAYYRVKLCEIFELGVGELGLDEQAEDGTATTPPSGDTPAAVAPSSVERPLWTIPYARNPHFTGRDSLLGQIAQQFFSAEAAQPVGLRRVALTQAQAIKGLGGIGKTQIAIEYAYRALEQKRYTHTLWISAASEESIQASFVALARLLPGDLVADEKDQQKLIAAVKRWLEECQHPWLLIVDNADDLALVQPFLPVRGKGDMLLTTRANAVGMIPLSFAIDMMGLVESTHFLLQRARRLESASPEEADEATNVAIELGQFPLALDQAAAYIEETGCSFHDYRLLYQQHRSRLLARRGRQVAGYHDPVATTWSLSLQKVKQTNPAAIMLLELCAFTAPDTIPEELLEQGAPYWPPLLGQAVASRFTLNQMLEALLSFSLIKRLTEDNLLSIHRLVQVVHLEGMQPVEQRQWAQRLVLAMHAVFPEHADQPENWSLCQRYLDQVQACDRLIQDYQFLLPEAADLLSRAGTYLQERAVYAQAETLQQRALRIWQPSQESNPLLAARQLARLAKLYHNWGKYGQCEQFYQQALSLYERPELRDDSGVADAMRGLANLYNNQGKDVQAEALYLRAIDFYEQRFGPQYRDLSFPLNGLAYVYVEQRKYARAEALCLRSADLLKQHLEPDSLAIANPLIILAVTYVEMGRYGEAEQILLQVRSIREKHLGSEHFNVAFVWHELAKLYQKQGKYEDAEHCYQRALKIREQQLGPDHRQVSDSFHRLGILYREQQRYVQAEECFRRSLRIREQLQNHDQFLVSDVIIDLAILYAEQRRDEEAERYFQQLLYLREQVAGLEDERLAEALYHLARFRQAQGRIQQATELYQRALRIQQRTLGADNPLTMATAQSMQELAQPAKLL
ncbi:helix-turn-helix domain-containing protein [Dictyobacter kobayashii]|uniref:Tetratricopeptide repeat protein n=1 Tax=Dictyobacter kobayashii TaxID=2014872 RepID=A0A402ANU8_9CHLR|nr:helix-turn-helix domain-containing protein [Dictyobacter kobayashii]GCE20871.1 tetratricopeptide repeat protein [Dictyobacter kobayashii]